MFDYLLATKEFASVISCYVHEVQVRSSLLIKLITIRNLLFIIDFYSFDN